MSRKFRRVVTGHDQNGVAVVATDQVATHVLQRPNRPGVTLTNFWLTDQTPAEYDGPTETCGGAFVLQPPANGSVFRCVEFQPEDPEVMAQLDGRSAFSEMGADDNIVENARHPFMHRTNTVDYAIVLSGEIYMLLVEDEVHLKASDVAVQRGTNHAWSNRGTEPCIIAFVLVDGVTQSDAEPGQRTGIPAR
jgi:hypothetical protein